MTWTDLLVVLVLAVVGWRLAQAAWISVAHRARSIEVVRGLRPRHVLLAVPVLVVVLVVATALLAVPGLSFGWWTALGGEGNPVFGSTGGEQGRVLDVVVPVVFGVLLVVALPLLVWAEEDVFRRGAERRSVGANLVRALVFGLVHALVGIPIAAALALSVGGVYLTWAYLRGWRRTGTVRGALLESSRAHLAYNLLIVTLLATVIALGW